MTSKKPVNTAIIIHRAAILANVNKYPINSASETELGVVNAFGGYHKIHQTIH